MATPCPTPMDHLLAVRENRLSSLFFSLLQFLLFVLQRFPSSVCVSRHFFLSLGGCHDQADAEWIVIWRPIWSYNNMPLGRPTSGRHIGRLGVGHPQGVFGVFSYYQLVMLFLNMVCLTVVLACR
jgi:hypothetical protein